MEFGKLSHRDNLRDFCAKVLYVSESHTIEMENFGEYIIENFSNICPFLQNDLMFTYQSAMQFFEAYAEKYSNIKMSCGFRKNIGSRCWYVSNTVFVSNYGANTKRLENILKHKHIQIIENSLPLAIYKFIVIHNRLFSE